MIKARIFIVEDEALIAMELKDRLEQYGHEVCGTAATGDDALRQVVERQPDLVLMDIRIAGHLDGIETARRILEQYDVPVVYLSAYSDDELIERAAATGPFGYLLKPFNEREVRVTIDLAVYRSHMERRLVELNRQLESSVEMLERQRQDILRLHRMGEALQKCSGLDEAYEAIKQSLQELFPQLPGFLAVPAPGDQFMEVKVNWGGLTVNDRFPSPACPTVLSGVMDLRGTGHPGVKCLQVIAPAPHSYLCLPLKSRDKVIGLLHLAEAQQPSRLLPATVELARAAAETMALALANIRLRERLNDQAIHDPLTGLHNRRYLEETLAHQVSQAVRAGHAVGLMMLDLDHFKLFNDTHGHEAGDRLLREFGAYVRKHTRQGDYVCRYGGEEFVVVLPYSPLEATRKRAESLRSGLPGMACEHLGKRLDGVTVSIGIAQCPEDGQTAEVLLRLADRALYRAKERGRNRVETAEEERQETATAKPEGTKS